MQRGNVAADHFQTIDRKEKKKQEGRYLHNGYHQKSVAIQSTFRSKLFLRDFFPRFVILFNLKTKPLCAKDQASFRCKTFAGHVHIVM